MTATTHSNYKNEQKTQDWERKAGVRGLPSQGSPNASAPAASESLLHEELGFRNTSI